VTGRKILAIDDCWTKVRLFGVLSGEGMRGTKIWPNFCPILRGTLALTGHPKGTSALPVREMFHPYSPDSAWKKALRMCKTHLVLLILTIQCRRVVNSDESNPADSYRSATNRASKPIPSGVRFSLSLHNFTTNFQQSNLIADSVSTIYFIVASLHQNPLPRSR
jgi:hypothetical protein